MPREGTSDSQGIMVLSEEMKSEEREGKHGDKHSHIDTENRKRAGSMHSVIACATTARLRGDSRTRSITPVILKGARKYAVEVN